MLMPLDFDPTAIRFLLTVFFFGDADGGQRWVRYLAAGSCEADPCTPRLRTLLDRQFSCTRPQVCEDRTWYMSPYFNEFRRPMDQDDLLFSYLPLPEFGCASAFGFTRSLNDRAFAERDRKLLHLFHQELGRLWTTPALSKDSAANIALSPRMRQTLDQLAVGKSEKQIAAHLGISRHTVHDHVKELHRRHGVSSLGELLAKSRPQWRFRPHLGLETNPPIPATR
jgi:DNA-binding CsgD family transcriptional regulator